MPKVGNKKFGYDKKSMKAAKAYAKKEGKEMEMSKKDYLKYEAKEYAMEKKMMKGKKKK